MIHTLNRDSAIAYIELCLFHTTAKRAVSEGSVEWLGGFQHIPPGNMPGWILRATSRFKKVWYISLTVSKRDSHKLIVTVIPEVPWKYWDGDKTDVKLYCGDRPRLYGRLKRWAKR